MHVAKAISSIFYTTYIVPLHLSASSALSPCMGIGSRGSCLLFVSLLIKFSHSHLCYYVIYPTCLHSTLSSCDSHAHMFSTFDTCSFCSALDFHYEYISPCVMYVSAF